MRWKEVCGGIRGGVGDGVVGHGVGEVADGVRRCDGRKCVAAFAV